MKLTLKKARMLAELKQAEVANALGVSEVTLSNWENGITFPTIDKVIKMSKLYNLPLEDFEFEIKEKQK